MTKTTKSTGRRSLVDENSQLNAGALDTLLQELCAHEHGWPFLKPVSKKMVSFLNLILFLNLHTESGMY